MDVHGTRTLVARSSFSKEGRPISLVGGNILITHLSNSSKCSLALPKLKHQRMFGLPQNGPKGTLVDTFIPPYEGRARILVRHAHGMCPEHYYLLHDVASLSKSAREVHDHLGLVFPEKVTDNWSKKTQAFIQVLHAS